MYEEVTPPVQVDIIIDDVEIPGVQIGYHDENIITLFYHGDILYVGFTGLNNPECAPMDEFFNEPTENAYLRRLFHEHVF